MMEELNHIVDKFWAGTATDTEKQQLIRQLTQEEKAWQDSLRTKYDQNLQNDNKPLTDKQSSLILARLHRQILGEETVRPVSVFRRNWMAWVAAAMLVLIGGWLVYQYRPGTEQTPAVAQQPIRPPWQLTHKTNTGNTVMNVALADGSTLKLQPGSSVSYYEPFGKPSRNISLTGDALFTVAKDPNHPFVVLANGFTTTALGTQFWVRAKEVGHVSVELLEGRVVVQAMPESGLRMSDTYLKPGQEFTADRATKQVRVEQLPAAIMSMVQPLAAPTPVAVVWLRFNKEPLSNVLAEVGKRYNVQIDVNPADVQGLSFSGTFIQSDSLRVVLGAVCSMNNLSFKQEQDTVIISKSPE